MEPVLAVFAGHAQMNVQNQQFAGGTVKDRRMSPDPTCRFDYSGVAPQRFISLSICGERGSFPYLAPDRLAPANPHRASLDLVQLQR